MNTLTQQLAAMGVDVSIEGPAVVAEDVSLSALREAIATCEATRPVDTVALAASIQTKIQEKWDEVLDDATLCASYASRCLTRNPAAPCSLG